MQQQHKFAEGRRKTFMFIRIRSWLYAVAVFQDFIREEKNFALLVANKFRALFTRAQKVCQQLSLFNLTPTDGSSKFGIKNFRLRIFSIPTSDKVQLQWNSSEVNREM